MKKVKCMAGDLAVRALPSGETMKERTGIRSRIGRERGGMTAGLVGAEGAVSR